MFLMGCASAVPKIQVKEVKIPVPYVPAPPEVERPNLLIKSLNEEDKKDIGKVSKAYGIDIQQITEYTALLEMIINKYRELSNSNPSIFDEYNIQATGMTVENWLKVRAVQKYFDNINK